MGRVESGQLALGDEVVVLPMGHTATVEELIGPDGSIPVASTGTNLGLVLSGTAGAARGCVVTTLGSSLRVTRELRGETFWIRPPSDSVLDCVCGVGEARARVVEPREIVGGKQGSSCFSLEDDLVVAPDEASLLSHLVIKDRGEIIGVGVVR
jgi:translation elongation factor EF-1alpha